MTIYRSSGTILLTEYVVVLFVNVIGTLYPSCKEREDPTIPTWWVFFLCPNVYFCVDVAYNKVCKITSYEVRGFEVNWLKEIRQKRMRTQNEVAELTGISIRYYQYLEKGEMKPQVSTAKKIADLLGFDWTLFFKEGESEEK